MKKRFSGLMLTALLGMCQLSARAEDIDLFNGTSADQSIAPNLLLVLDNAASFSASANQTSCRIGNENVVLSLNGSVGGVEQCALYNVVRQLDLSNAVNLGVMVYNGPSIVDYQNQACGSNGDGGCLVYPLTRIDNETTRTAVLDWIRTWQTSNGGDGSKWIKASRQRTGATMQEAWAYFYGKKGLSGTNYASIKPDIRCKNFMVFIGNAVGAQGSPGDSTGDAGPKNALEGTNTDTLKNANPNATTAQKALLTLRSGITPANTSCGLASVAESNHENVGFYADEWTRYMNAQRISTYTVGFIDSQCKPEYAWLLSSMAKNGGGTYFQATSYEQLVNALNTIVSEVRSVNSVFAAVSLPVSVNSQGTYLNQVFVGLFRPDPNGLPRWYGNLKQYRMGFYQGAFSLLDAGDTTTPNGYPAISAAGAEFLSECARSFWTPLDQDDYWVLNTVQNCSSTDAKSNYKDGNMVEKGGQAYVLRTTSPADRVVKTCDSTVSSCTTLTDFNASNSALTTTTMGLPSSSSPITNTTLIAWARGQNVALEPGHKNGTPSSPGTDLASTDMRPSVHGDIVHSRPAAINFGSTDDNSKVVVFYGGNDGMLRAINGNRTAAFNVNGVSTQAGKEFWSFLPPEFYTKLYRRYRNEAGDRITASNPKDYAMDGPITAYRESSTTDALLYVGLRRGGRSLYAFQVNKDTMNITLTWKRGCVGTGSGNCDSTGQFTGIGQTWSAPQVFRARGVTGPVLIFGGGYDTCEDTVPASCGGGSTGKQFYVMKADGEHQKTLSTERPVIADVTVVPDEDGYAKYIYGVDLGGNLYRISGPKNESTGIYAAIGSNAPSTWQIRTIARLGCTKDEDTCDNNRKFMFAPDVVWDGTSYVLLLGSGDREKPTNTSNPTSNYFFMIKDRPDLSETAHLADSGCSRTTSLCLNSLVAVERGGSATASAVAEKKGWYLALNSNEQVVTGALAVFGTVYFTTHEPQAASSNACVPNLGKSRAYAIKYATAGNARTDSNDAFVLREDAGLAPDLVAGRVTLDASDGGSTVPFCIGCDGPIKPSQPIPPGLIKNPAKIRSYWYLQK